MGAPKKSDKNPLNKFPIITSGSSNTGRRIILYGRGGSGKSTLASMAPDPVLLPIAAGSQEIVSPLTNTVIPYIKVDNYDMLLELLDDDSSFRPGQTVIIDDVSSLETWMETYIVANFQTNTHKPATHFRDFNWDRFFLMLTEWRKIQQRVERHWKRGVNFIFIAHAITTNLANAEEDYIVNTPRFNHQNKVSESSLESMFEWCDYSIEIDFIGKEYDSETKNGKTKTKVTGGSRAIFTQNEVNHPYRKIRFKAVDPPDFPPVISFEKRGDASFWGFLFPDKYEYSEETSSWKYTNQVTETLQGK